MINELAWAGTYASANDEWIELFNTSNGAINLTGWTLTDGGDIRINLQGTISSKGYFLLERTDNSTIVDISANQIYRGNLRNSGEALRLTDPSGSLVDSANGGGGSWPAGDPSLELVEPGMMRQEIQSRVLRDEKTLSYCHHRLQPIFPN